MFSIFLKVLTRIGGFFLTMLIGTWGSELLAHEYGLGAVGEFAVQVLLWIFGVGSYMETLRAVLIAVAEAKKITRETIVWAEEDDAQRKAREAALVRWHGNKIYLFGDVSLSDAVLLWWSVDTLADTEMVASVFQVAGDAAVIL